MMRPGRSSLIITLGLVGVATGIGPSFAQNCRTESREHCANLDAESGTDSFPVSGVLVGTPNLQTSVSGFRPSIASIAGVGQSSFDVSWQAGALSCVRYQVDFCSQ
jgi:hypothetical protein